MTDTPGFRYQAIPVSTEEGAQLERFRYVLANGCKEGLVERLRDWPGVHCVRALLEGEALEGLWFNRTQEYSARIRREEYDHLRYAEAETITLSPLPCWRDLSETARRQRIAQMVEEIEGEAARMREQTGRPAVGAQALLPRILTPAPSGPRDRRRLAFTRSANELVRSSCWHTGSSCRLSAWPRTS